MKGIDTNVLVRYLVQDDPKQAKQAADFIENKCSSEKPAFINGTVICKLVWVLETSYQFSRASVVTVLEKIMTTRQFHIYQHGIIWQTIFEYRNSSADFADSYIALLNSHHGCDFTVTFDKKAAKLKRFKKLN